MSENTLTNSEKEDLNGPQEVILRTEDVSVAYDGTPAIANVTLGIFKNQITGFIGPSGCGKSTLLRCFNRLNDAITRAEVTGKIFLHEREISRINPVEVRRRIGMVFQRPNPFPKSVYENIALGLRVNGYRGEIDERVEHALRQVGLWEEVKNDLRKNALHLSGGQQQRLCIARAIALNPEILLMDEPCSALDPISSSRIDYLLEEMKQQYTIVIVTHNLKQAARVTDMVAFFNVDTTDSQRVGRLVEYAPTTVIFRQPNVQATWEYVYQGFSGLQSGSDRLLSAESSE
ncbi:ATP-binding cassette domain-containing protein [Geitlerinema sp. PCC 9228]|jgi:phosphate transport system ATP-binding protein|uniref:phosphate ABC transporter ATP-binding protein n=1 Tax=Geitlerinema sp. PCC 9228 TaxID=111611 RepID=UPI0008F98DD6|nr:ATP-binding cassette domain-containing protein [Geitlerinema sp. PCC 9228]